MTGPPNVYLDQNKWIELARAHYGRREHSARRLAVRAIETAAEHDNIIAPLSFGHYIETGKNRNESGRLKLAQLMYVVSKGRTIAEYNVILRHEMQVALGQLFPGRVRVDPFAFIGYGVAHMMNKPAYVEPPAWLRNAVPPKDLERLRHEFQEEFDRSTLSGYSSPLGVKGPAYPDSTPFSRNFMRHLAAMQANVAELSSETRERAIRAASLLDCLDNINQTLHEQGIPADEFEALSVEGWERFLQLQPLRRADMHLRRQWISNRSLRPKEGDLNDWAFLSIAVMYCDVVVMEKRRESSVPTSSLA